MQFLQKLMYLDLTASVATEDNRNILLWVILAVVALLLIGISTAISLKNRKNRQNEEDSDDSDEE
ncbi:MAG: hypothetical protein K2H29_05060 [Oscillospiraceae bacterium]|nr:hypothetical protein [Oscillospiraceae bacterium]MDE5884431.1 hypothetical protein [Oscillospiraceae bacterium]